MAHPKPTSANPFALRVVAQGVGDAYFFPSLQALACSLARRLPLFSMRYPLSGTIVSVDGTCLTWSRTTHYQADHGHYGAVVRTKVESVTFEAFEFGRLLQIATLLNVQPPKIRPRKPAHGDRGHGPVPWTRKYRGGGFGFIRHPRTTAEMRANVDAGCDDNEPAARASRNSIPSAWDDKMRVVERNWKSQRKVNKQWQR